MANGQHFTLTFDAQLNVSQMKGALGQIQSTLNGLHLPANISRDLQSTFNKLSNEVKNFEILSGKDLTDKMDFTKMVKSADKIVDLFDRLKSQVSDLGASSASQLEKMFPASVTQNIQEATKALSDYDAKINKVTGDISKAQADVDKFNKALERENGKTVVDKNTYSGIVENLKQAQTEVEEYRNKLEELKNQQAELESKLSQPGKSSIYRNLIKEISDVENKLQSASQKAAEFARQKVTTTTFEKHAQEVEKLQTKLQEAQTKLQGFEQSLAQLKSTSDGGGLKELIDLIGQLTGLDMSKFSADAQGAGEALRTYFSQQIQELQTNLSSASGALEQYGGALRKTKQDADGAAIAHKQFTDQIRDVSALKSRIQYFFGISNAINLVKRAIRSAINTVKELDAAMTETAVVTKNTVSDMWQKLPEYTKRANELGVSTLDAYKAATLYYQQGLNDEQAGVLSAETLKMARIAGLDAAEATDRMTNALRGFNMELNATSAQRVDDVYSQLAAMSASNVDEISTAMTKVASLAHSANMEFETTAAFLAQIIETTRESAETAGTALKTVVARFSEVKKLYSENQLKGTDEEGQGIDVNKIGTALRTAGIDLNKYFLGEVGLDDIFMELASKWDSLTSVQQRYIATQAAGSRQQSRFIALMQDYARTQELVSAAYDANGASARQFEKTQESLQSKLARLKNAWNEFLMGLANNTVIKLAVDLLTNLLNVVNNLTSVFGNGVGSVLKWVAAISAFGGIKSLFKSQGFVDKALMGALSGTNLGSALVSNKILSGAQFGNVAVKGSAAAEGGMATGTGMTLGTLLGSGAKKLWGKAINFGQGVHQKVGGALAGLTTPMDVAAFNAATGTAPEVAALGETGAGLLGIGTALAGIAAAAAAVYGIYQAWLKLTPTGQLKVAQKYADAMSDVATSTQKQASELKKASQQIKEYDSAVNNATSVSAHKEAIQDRNDYIQSLLDQNSKYADYLTTTFEDGQMVLKLEIDAADLDKAINGAKMAQAGSDFAQAAVIANQAKILQKKLLGVDLTNKTITDVGYGDTGSVQVRRALTNAEIAEYTKYQNQLNGYTSQFNNYAQKAFAELIPTDQVSDEVATLMTQALAQGFDDTQLPTGTGWLRTRSHWQNEYLQRYGTEADSELKTADIYRAVKQYDLTQGRAESAAELAGLLTGSSKDFYQSILEGFTGTGRISSQNLLGLEITSENDVFKFLGLDTSAENFEQQLNTLSKILGVEVDDLKTIVKDRAKAEKRAQARTASNTIGQMLMGQGKMPSQQNFQNIADYLQLENTADQKLFNDLFSSFDASFLSDEVVASLLKGVKEGGNEVTDWIKSIDLSNPIQSFNKLNDAAKNGTGEIQTTAQALLDAGKASEQFSASAQVGYFATSSSFDALSDQLDKFIDENGRITSANVRELTDANADLNALLENNIVSASGLAAVLTELQQGTINAWDLTDAILAAASAMDDLSGIAEQTINDLNNFDPGFDENDITGFIQKALKNANENIEKGAYGNNQMRNYMEHIFGSFDEEFKTGKWGDDYGTAYKSWLSSNTAWLEANSESMFSAWSDFSKTLTDQQLKLFDESGEVIEKAATVYEENGEIIIQAQGMTTDQLIQAMVQTGKVTEQQARMMITDYKNYSADFAHEMAINDLPNAIQTWIDNLPNLGEGTAKIFDVKDYETLGHLLGLSTNEVKQYVEQLKGYGTEFKGISFVESEGPNKGKRTRSSILGGWEQAGVDISQMTKPSWVHDQDHAAMDPDKQVQLLDYDAIKENYEKAGLVNMFEQDFQTILGESRQFTATMFDEQRTVSVRAGQTVGEAYAEEYQRAVNANLAGEIGKEIAKLFEDGGESTIDFIANYDNLEDPPPLEGQANYSPDFTECTDDKVPTLTGVVNYTVGHVDQPAAEVSASGGIVGSYASGSENNHLSPGISLTGEEGPEIIWNKDKGYAYITGENHPEFQNLRPGDRVFNAQETKKILGGAASGGMVPSFARGYGGGSSTAKSSGGGGGGGGGGKGSSGSEKTPEEWKNELDWLYNLLEDIAELERDQKAIEEQYEDLLQDQNKTGQDLYKLLIKQLGNLYTQLEHQQFALEKREQEMREFMNVTNDKDQYLWYNWQDRTIEIDWDAIDQITDEEEYKHVKDLIDEAEEIQDKMDDADDAIMDITNQIQELENIWRDTYVDFEKRVYDAIVKSYQQIIDNYSELNDTLNDSNSRILDSLQREIDLQRQIRDNTKTEEEITNDEARLAYLRRDTSGGNEVEAKGLEKDLEEKRQNYTDSLVDQAINRLQEDNDLASQQREKQIEIMQAQLDYQSENGEFNDYVRELLDAAIDEDGKLLNDSNLVELLKEQENWDAMSAVSKQVWEEELNNTFKEVVAFLLKQNSEQNGTFYTALTEAIKGVSSAIGSYSQAMVKIGSSYSGVGGSSGGGGGSGGGVSPDKGSQSSTIVIKGTANIDTGKSTYSNGWTSSKGGYWRSYDTGGMASYTGPAWLDGTPQEPEYVLNARQTDAFLKLADVLPSMMNTSGFASTNTFGGSTYNFSINLDSVSPDYDVDRMVSLVKEKLYDSGSYRNVNSLSFIR